MFFFRNRSGCLTDDVLQTDQDAAADTVPGTDFTVSDPARKTLQIGLTACWQKDVNGTLTCDEPAR